MKRRILLTMAILSLPLTSAVNAQDANPYFSSNERPFGLAIRNHSVKHRGDVDIQTRQILWTGLPTRSQQERRTCVGPNGKGSKPC